jgi:death-on-curing protein
MVMSEESDSVNYLSTDDILAIHELIVESNEDTEPGIPSPGDVAYAVEHVREGHFGQVPESLHEKAYQLLRLLAANHPFVDGNKRTALMSVRIFYALNGLKFDYDREVKAILKELATDEADVSEGTVLSYLREHTEPLAPEYAATIELWFSRIEDVDALPTEVNPEDFEGQSEDEPNGYDGDSPSES